MSRRQIVTGLLGLGAGLPMSSLIAAPAWRTLGSKTVSLGVDRDVIRVAPWAGRYDKIKIRVELNDIEMLSLAVVYGNGRRDELPVRLVIRRNTETKPLDLRGEGRNIEKIEMIYLKNPTKPLPALVTVLGRIAA
jgi:hypothetical protein